MHVDFVALCILPVWCTSLLSWATGAFLGLGPFPTDQSRNQQEKRYMRNVLMGWYLCYP